jgi:hypothetical protein
MKHEALTEEAGNVRPRRLTEPAFLVREALNR